MKGQLALTQPTRRVNVNGMTQRQRFAWKWARILGGTFTPREFAEWTGYKDPHHAISRMCQRGLITRAAPGLYKSYTPGERKR